MDKYWVDITLIFVVGIAGIYTSYLVSPYIAKGLEVVSEQVITLPLPEEKETTKFVFFALSYLVVIQMISSLVDVSFDYSFINIEPVIPVVNEVINEVTRYTSLRENIINDQIFLGELNIVTNFLNNSNSVRLISDCLLMKLFNSCLIFSPEFLKYFYEIYLQNSVEIAAIPNHELLSSAKTIRYYYLARMAGLNIDYNALILKCGFFSDQEMMLQLMETCLRFGSSMGGVSTHELILRNIMALQAYEVNPDMFNAKWIMVDGLPTLINNEMAPIFYIDGSINPYTWTVDGYDHMDIQGTNVCSIIGKSKVLKALWFYCKFMVS